MNDNTLSPMPCGPTAAVAPSPASSPSLMTTGGRQCPPADRRGRRSLTERSEWPRLVFSPLAWLKLMLLMHAGDTEVGCFGVCSADDPLYVEDLAVPRQYVSVVTVRFDDDSVADHFDRMADQGVTPARCGRVWVHTHPGDSANPSGTDEETFARAFGDADWAVMAIAARGGRTYARLSFSAGPGGSVELPVSVDWSKWPQVLLDDEAETSPLGPLFEGWMNEYAHCVESEQLRARLGVDPAADGSSAALVAAEETNVSEYVGWDYLDLQEAYALQELDEIERRRLESWRGGEGGFHE